MDKPTTEPKTNARRAKRPAKVFFQGVEIQRPTVPPTTPLWRIQHGMKIAVQQYADELVAIKSAAHRRNDNSVTTCYPGGLGEAPMTVTAPKRDTLNLRVKPSDRSLIDRAAEVTGKTRTDFILDATRRAAEEALMDQTQFILSAEAYAEFLARLDAPPEPNERLQRMLNTPAPWE
jgi:uncharacterized protein (DUF1778 family)